jgi:succinylglutamate desuccinylase
MKRLIGEYSGAVHGVLIIAIGAIHGNEPAGVRALRDLFDMLENESKVKPSFQFQGRIVGIIGNLQAYERRIRYIKKDLNRSLTTANIELSKAIPPERIAFEDLEILELTQFIDNEIRTYQPTQLIVLDLHTTSADGGIFTIVNDDKEGLEMASTLFAPVVRGLVKGTGGSTLHYFTTENMGIPTLSMAFEGGQHEDSASVRRIIAWLVNSLRALGCVKSDDVEHRHDEVLRRYSKGLPKAVEIIGHHHISPHDNFKMIPGYLNFQAIKKGEILATDITGNITTPEDCLILMPLYQPKGNDGFFLVKEIGIIGKLLE